MRISSKQKQPYGTFINCYEFVDVLEIKMAKTEINEIKKLIDEGLNNNIITQEEYNAIYPRD